MDLVLVRHGRPVRIEGAEGGADPELTELGHRQAKAMADWLAAEHFDALYVSPMMRARQTAHPLEHGSELTAEVVPGVQEFDAAESVYIPMEELKVDKDQWRKVVADYTGRDMTQFSDVVVSSLEELIAAHRGDRIAVICHGGVVNMWAAKVLGLAPRMFFEPDYTSISRFVAASSGQRSIASLNEVAHLRSLS